MIEKENFIRPSAKVELNQEEGLNVLEISKSTGVPAAHICKDIIRPGVFERMIELELKIHVANGDKKSGTDIKEMTEIVEEARKEKDGKNLSNNGTVLSTVAARYLLDIRTNEDRKKTNDYLEYLEDRLSTSMGTTLLKMAERLIALERNREDTSKIVKELRRERDEARAALNNVGGKSITLTPDELIKFAEKYSEKIRSDAPNKNEGLGEIEEDPNWKTAHEWEKIYPSINPTSVKSKQLGASITQYLISNKMSHLMAKAPHKKHDDINRYHRDGILGYARDVLKHKPRRANQTIFESSGYEQLFYDQHKEEVCQEIN